MGFINENVQYNKNVVIDTMKKCSNDVDIVIFGEAFLQGFYGATFEIEHDEKLAIVQNDLIIKEICSVAKEYGIAVSFGFIEKAEDCFYSSQITIDSNGNIIDLYRRVSPGWKEKNPNANQLLAPFTALVNNTPIRSKIATPYKYGEIFAKVL